MITTQISSEVNEGKSDAGSTEEQRRQVEVSWAQRRQMDDVEFMFSKTLNENTMK